MEKGHFFLAMGRWEAAGVDFEFGGVVGGTVADVQFSRHPDDTCHAHRGERADAPVVGEGGNGVRLDRAAAAGLGEAGKL